MEFNELCRKINEDPMNMDLYFERGAIFLEKRTYIEAFADFSFYISLGGDSHKVEELSDKHYRMLKEEQERESEIKRSIILEGPSAKKRLGGLFRRK